MASWCSLCDALKPVECVIANRIVLSFWAGEAGTAGLRAQIVVAWCFPDPSFYDVVGN